MLEKVLCVREADTFGFLEMKYTKGKSYKYGITQNITYGCVAEWSMALASGANIFVCMGSNPISVNLFFAILALRWMHMRLCNHVHFFVVVGHIAKALGHHDHV